MPATFGSVWRMVRLHVPDAPPMLVRDWVQTAYAQITDFRPWSWTYEFGQIVWQDAEDLDVTVTNGSATVTSAALFTAGMQGRQFRVGTFPIYTVQDVVDANTITLDATFQGASDGAVTGQILDAFTTLPANFRNFTALVDPVLQRWVPWWMTNEELDLLDPTRTSGGAPQVLAFLDLSTYAPTLGQNRYQFWPIPTVAGSLQYYMRTAPSELADETPLKGVLAHRPDVVQSGALAQAALWPGTRDRPNPYFNLSVANRLAIDFQKGLFQLDLRDDDANFLSIDKLPWQRWSAWSWAYNTHYLQMTDATLGAYVGQSGFPDWGY